MSHVGRNAPASAPDSQPPDNAAVFARLTAIEERLDEISRRLDEIKDLVTMLNHEGSTRSDHGHGE